MKINSNQISPKPETDPMVDQPVNQPTNHMNSINSTNSNVLDRLMSINARRPRLTLFFTVLSLVLVFAVTVFAVKAVNDARQNGTEASVYQAVFLNNNTNQVYFGKLVKQTETFLELTNVYYPKNSRSLQPDYTLPISQPQEQVEGKAEGQPEVEAAANAFNRTPANTINRVNNAELQVIKLGGEMHRPQDKLIIPVSSVLFMQDIQADSYLAKVMSTNK